MLKRFVTCDSGNMVVMTVLILTTLMALIALSVDLGRAIYAQQVLQQAADIGTAACASDYLHNGDDNQALESAEAFAEINIPKTMFNGGVNGKMKRIRPKLDKANDECFIQPSARITTTFAKTQGEKKIKIGADSATQISDKALVSEVVFVLDFSKNIIQSQSAADAVSLGAAKSANILFNRIPKNAAGEHRVAVGGIAYARKILGKKKPTTDFNDFTSFFKKIKVKRTKDIKSTNVNKPILQADDLLYEFEDLQKGSISKGMEYVVLMSANRDNRGNSRARLLQACENYKNYPGKDTKRYIITLGYKSADKAFLRECASSPDLFFYAQSASQLEAAFEDIGHDLANLMLTVRLIQ